jgi:hypothetical protein
MGCGVHAAPQTPRTVGWCEQYHKCCRGIVEFSCQCPLSRGQARVVQLASGVLLSAGAASSPAPTPHPSTHRADCTNTSELFLGQAALVTPMRLNEMPEGAPNVTETLPASLHARVRENECGARGLHAGNQLAWEVNVVYGDHPLTELRRDELSSRRSSEPWRATTTTTACTRCHSTDACRIQAGPRHSSGHAVGRASRAWPVEGSNFSPNSLRRSRM